MFETKVEKKPNFKKYTGFTYQKGEGFTLIELLVVIAIIRLLSSIVFASLDGARDKARDTAAVATLKEFQKAVELCFDKRGTYNLAETTLSECYRSSFNDGDFRTSWANGCGEFLDLPTELGGRAVYHTANSGQNYVILYDIPNNHGAMSSGEVASVVANTIGGSWSACNYHDYAIGH